ncbi:MAG: hypothetical protein ABR559_07740 [Gemmatimonadota bacterium]
MTIQLKVRGAHELAALSRRLKTAGNKRELERELFRGLNRAVKPIRAGVKASALETLPSGGGLAAIVAKSKITVRRRTSGAGVGIRMVGSHEHDIRAMDRGKLRKPLFGDKRHWYMQLLQPGWWTTPTQEGGEDARGEIVRVVAHIKKRIEG